MWFLGIDVGTGGTRAVLVDEQGRVVSSASEEHAPFRVPHPGWAEQDPEDWWRAAQEAINGAISAAVRASGEAGAKIEAVGLTGQMHGAVMLDSTGEVLRPSLIWCDQRTGPQCDWLHERIGRERLIELTCNPALPNFTLTKLLWVKEQPGITAPIIGPRTSQHLQEALSILEAKLSADVSARLDELNPPGSVVADFFNTSNWSKMRIPH